MLGPKPLVVYHAGCPDGVCAAWAAWRKFGDGADYLPARHHDDFPSDDMFALRDVYLVDFSYPLSALDLIKSVAKSVTVLDHHLSAYKDLKGTQYAEHIRMDQSGARIAWHYFNPHSDVPTVVRYVEDNDLWHHKLPDWEAIKVVVEMMDLNAPDVIQKWEEFSERMESSFWEIKEQGSAIVTYRNSIIQQAVHGPAFALLDGHKVPCVNATNWQSEIGNILGKGQPFAIVWRATKDGAFAYSLRSDQETGVGVSVIAKKFGGGGHERAAGFTSNAPPMLVPRPKN